MAWYDSLDFMDVGGILDTGEQGKRGGDPDKSTGLHPKIMDREEFKRFESIRKDIEEGKKVPMDTFEEAYEDYYEYLDAEYDNISRNFISDMFYDNPDMRAIQLEMENLKALYGRLKERLELINSGRLKEKTEAMAKAAEEAQKSVTPDKMRDIFLEQQKGTAGIFMRHDIENYVEESEDDNDIEDILGGDYGSKEFSEEDTEFALRGLFLALNAQGGQKLAAAAKEELRKIEQTYGNGGLTFKDIVDYFGTRDLGEIADRLITEYGLHDDQLSGDRGGEYVMGYILGCIAAVRQTDWTQDKKAEYEKYVFSRLDAMKGDINKGLDAAESNAGAPDMDKLKDVMAMVAGGILSPDNWKAWQEYSAKNPGAEKPGAEKPGAAIEKTIETQLKKIEKFLNDCTLYVSATVGDFDVLAKFSASDLGKKYLELANWRRTGTPPNLDINIDALNSLFLKEANELTIYRRGKISRVFGTMYLKLIEGTSVAKDANCTIDNIDLNDLKNPKVIAKLQSAGIDPNEFSKVFTTALGTLKDKTTPLDAVKLNEVGNKLWHAQLYTETYYEKITKINFYKDYWQAGIVEERVMKGECKNTPPPFSCEPLPGQPAESVGKAPVERPASGTGVCKPVERPVSGTGEDKPVERPMSGTGEDKPVERPVSGTGAEKLADGKRTEKPADGKRAEMKENADKYVTVNEDGILTFKDGADKYITLGDYYRKGMDREKFILAEGKDSYIMVSLKGGGEVYLAKWNGKEFNYVEGPKRGKRAGIWEGTKILKPKKSTIHSVLGTKDAEAPDLVVPRVNETKERTSLEEAAEKKFADYLLMRMKLAKQAMLGNNTADFITLVDECGEAADKVDLPDNMRNLHFRIHLPGFGDLQYHEGKILTQQGMAEWKHAIIPLLYVSVRQALRQERKQLKDKPEEYIKISKNVLSVLSHLRQRSPIYHYSGKFWDDLLDDAFNKVTG